MRKMKKNDMSVTVYAHAITSNGWEYYLLDGKHRSDIRDALVIGFENEIGSVSMKEIQPYMVSYAYGDSIKDLMPAPEWVWE